VLVRLLKPPHAPCPSHLLLDRQCEELALGLGVLQDRNDVCGQLNGHNGSPIAFALYRQIQCLREIEMA
jgi:hypothetical protein